MSDATADMQHASTTAAVAAPHVRTERATPRARRRPAHTALDARTWEFKLLQKTRDELTAHVGGSPSAVQRAMIERAAQLALHLAKQDAKTAAGEFMSEHATRQYLAWNNSLVRTMKLLGFKSTPPRAPTLNEHIAARARGAAA